MTKEISKFSTPDEQYELFVSNLKEQFAAAVTNDVRLFQTNAQGLYDLYLSNLPEKDRQGYTCNACRNFIERFGGLVTIDKEGRIQTPLWDVETAPAFFKASVQAMNEAVLSSKVVSVFLTSERTLGLACTGEWTHLSVNTPTSALHTSYSKTAGQTMAELREEYKMLTNALLEYSYETVSKAVTLLQSHTMYRSNKVLGIAEWFKALIEKRESATNSKIKANLTWFAVATAPTGYCHVRSSMIGTLLDDIQEALSVDIVKRRFEEKMNPNNYMRSQAAPTENALYEAEKLVEKLGIANSLQRRYATFEEIPSFIWTPAKVAAPVATKTGVFGHIATKEKKQSTEPNIEIPKTVMTWAKFERTILPTAKSLEVLVENQNRLMALVTATDNTAPNILKWNNPFSWYYHGGIDGEIQRRVEQAGGRYQNNEIRVSLIWEGYTDLDLHCITPNQEHIYYHHKKETSGSKKGWLDIDMNGGSHRNPNPVENIRWEKNAPTGRYQFLVHNYAKRNEGVTPFKVELEINGQVFSHTGVMTHEGERVVVFQFDYVKGQVPTIVNSTAVGTQGWNVQTNSFVKVTGITNSPNQWDDTANGHTSGNHIFFLLDDVKDLSEGKGRGFFNEMLKPELREIRKTLEAYTAATPIADVEKASACGIGYTEDTDWNLTIRVVTDDATRLIQIDRWD